VIVCGITLYAVLSRGSGRPRSVAWQDLSAQVAPVELGAIEQRRFRKATEFARYLRLVETGPSFTIPRVDFTRNEVVMFGVGPRSSAGYSLAVRRVSVADGATVVTVDERSPRLGSHPAPRLTFPFVLIALPRSAGPLSVDWPQRP
jgi:hypothetical protein